MDIGLLFGMENLDGTISPASYSRHDISALLTNSSPVSRAHSSPRNVRTRMRSLPSFDDPAPLWPHTDLPMNTRTWPPEDLLRYTPPLQTDRSTITTSTEPPNILGVEYSSSPASHSPGHRISRSFHQPGGMPANPASSPPREDIAWQMYISSSVSLEFGETHSAASHPAVDDTVLRVSGALSIPHASLSSSGSANVLPATINPALFLQLSPQASSNQPGSQIPVSASYHETAFSSWTTENSQQHQHMPTIHPDGTYSVPIAQPMALQSSALPGSAIPAASPGSSPQRAPPLLIAQPKPTPARPGQGISGWSGTNLLQIPSPTLRPKRRPTSPPISPVAGMKRPAKASPLSSTTGDEANCGLKRSRRSTSLRLRTPAGFDFGEEDDFDDNGDSDEYNPSRSVSPDFTCQHTGFSDDDGGSKAVPFPRKKMRRTKGKAKGSAALALALVSQMGNKPVPGSELPDDIGVNIDDAFALYQEGRIGIRKRKNQPIPLPVPIPNLNKKSRGRKVPYVADLSGSQSPSPSLRSGSSGFSSGSKEEDGFGRNSIYEAGAASVAVTNSGRSSRSRRAPASNRSTPLPDDGSGPRSFVCVVEGCGKCFVRGEHLKRHVRSIHTNDKPHQCPYEGCDKSFSRRDNLGQHVRIHLQP